MIEFVESLVWVLGTRILRFDLPPALGTISLPAVTGGFARAGAARLTVGSQWDDLRFPDRLVLDLDKGALDVLGSSLAKVTPWQLRALTLQVHASGLLLIQVRCEVTDQDSAKRFEDVGDEINEWLTEQFPIAKGLVDFLCDHAVLRRAADFSFGTPTFLRGYSEFTVWSLGASPFDGLLYNLHLFVIDEARDLAAEIAAATGLEAEPLEYRGSEVFPGRACYVWHVTSARSRNGVDGLLDVDWVVNGKQAIASTGCTAFAKILMALTYKERFGLQPAAVRNVINLHRVLLLRMERFEHYLDESQAAYCRMQRKLAETESVLESYRSAEQSLLAGVEGLETERSSDSAQRLQIAVLGLASLTVFSVFTDLRAYLADQRTLSAIDPWKAAPLCIGLFAVGALFWLLFRKRSSQ
ncbi:MAG: hypothetical protein IPJ17_04370 [Holophagales bacterium]|jgi:hypothetical protein|nr:MAG: hypothetical protein IPJ17_04370 [Holophagales bacterium]